MITNQLTNNNIANNDFLDMPTQSATNNIVNAMSRYDYGFCVKTYTYEVI